MTWKKSHIPVKWFSEFRYEEFLINVREYRRGNQKWIIQRNWQHSVYKMKKNKTKQKHNIICVGHH